MEGKYIINMPKGTTPRTRKILEQQQAAKGTGLAGVCAGIACASLWSHPTGTGGEAGSKGTQGTLDQGDSDGSHRGGGGHHSALCPEVSVAGLLSPSAWHPSPGEGGEGSRAWIW